MDVILNYLCVSIYSTLNEHRGSYVIEMSCKGCQREAK